MQKSQPFARANMMMGLVAAAMSLAGSAQQEALAKIPAYESRGKGKGGSFLGCGRPGAGMASIRAARKTRNVRRSRAANR